VPSFGHRRDYTYGLMQADLLERGNINVKDAIFDHPAQGQDAQRGAQLVTATDLNGEQAPTGKRDQKAYESRKRKELELIKRWLHGHCAGPNAPLWSETPSKAALKAFVKEKIGEFLRYGGPAAE
jgi:hypothetical protein